MRTNPIQTREGDIREVIKATFEKFIPKVWYDCYQRPKYQLGNYQEIQLNSREVPDLKMKLCRNRLEVTRKDELYIVDWNCDPRTAVFSDFLISSNWGSPSASQVTFPLVLTALTLHMAQSA